MLKIRIVQFIDYCKVSNFAEKSIESLRLKLHEFNRFMNKSPDRSVQDISYRHLKEFRNYPILPLYRATIFSSFFLYIILVRPHIHIS